MRRRNHAVTEITLTVTDSVLLQADLTLARITLRDAGFPELADDLRRHHDRVGHAQARARVWLEDEPVHDVADDPHPLALDATGEHPGVCLTCGNAA